MQVSRDRLSRPLDILTLLENAERQANLIVDEPGLHSRGVSIQNVSIGHGSGGGSGSGCRLARRTIRGQRTRLRNCGYLNRFPVDQENRTPMSARSGQGRRSLLPSWYPRTPLRDITAIARAIERKRAEINQQRTEASQQEVRARESNVQTGNDMSDTTPIRTMAKKIPTSLAPQACKIMDTMASEKAKDFDFITPQKKLLSSIDKVSDIWQEEQRNMKKTPADKWAEREKKMRTLMSMR